MVETSNLDGERNLKRFRPMQPSAHLHSSEALHQSLDITATVEPPNERLYKFVGQVLVSPALYSEYVRIRRDNEVREKNSEGMCVFSVNAENVALRGARLKQTDHVFGMIVYAGMESKLQMNANKSSAKFSQVEKSLNIYIMWLFAVNIALCFGLTGGSYSVYPEVEKSWYLYDSFEMSRADQLLNVLTYFVLLNSIIPLSLVVSMELSVLAQALFMMWDHDMRSEERGGMLVMSSGLNSELGLVEYVLCDKTGTLTQNKMVFKHCSVGGRTYYEPMSGELKGKGPDAAGFCRALALCHDVFVEKPLGEAFNAEAIQYMYSSPDEVALVHAGAANGFELVARDQGKMTLKENGQFVSYKLLAQLEFTSERRRMGVVVQSADGQFLLIVKGADSALLPLCQQQTNPDILRKCLTDLTDFAEQGHRVMLVCQRTLQPSECEAYLDKYRRATNLLQGREEALDEAYLMLERDLVCVGVTCVEDKLQDKVPETVRFLLAANMHVWILTGDKLETAITIAYSSSIIQKGMKLTVIDEEEWNGVSARLQECVQDIDANPDAVRALVIGGVALALARDRSIDLLVKICSGFRVVVCARCAPAQKAQMVTLITQKLGKVTLSVGDGGNDVPMINAAHVGVGIMGNEGMQAARSADFAIGEYKMLQKLVAVHGRYSLLRITDLIKYSFFKNVCFCTPQIVLAFFSRLSAQSFHNSWIILAFNIVFTGLPPIMLAVFEKDLSEELLYLYPEAYSAEERQNALSLSRFALWESHAIWQGVVIALALLYGLNDDSAGGNVGLDHAGMLLASMIICTVTLKLGILIRYWTLITHFFFWGCLLASYIVLLLLDIVMCPDSAPEPIQACGTILSWVLVHPRAWALLVIGVGAAALPDVVLVYIQRNWFPNEWQKIQAIAADGNSQALRQPPKVLSVEEKFRIEEAERQKRHAAQAERRLENGEQERLKAEAVQQSREHQTALELAANVPPTYPSHQETNGHHGGGIPYSPRQHQHQHQQQRDQFTAYDALELLHFQQMTRHANGGVYPGSYVMPTGALVFGGGAPVAGQWHPPGQSSVARQTSSAPYQQVYQSVPIDPVQSPPQLYPSLVNLANTLSGQHHPHHAPAQHQDMFWSPPEHSPRHYAPPMHQVAAPPSPPLVDQGYVAVPQMRTVLHTVPAGGGMRRLSVEAVGMDGPGHYVNIPVNMPMQMMNDTGNQRYL